MGSRPSGFQLSSPGPLRLYSTEELLTLPPPSWLIENIIPEGSLCALYGPPESTKSFIAIDLALCVATGRAWHGHLVLRGFVLYVAAEGGPGLSKRVRAWLIASNLPASDADVAWLIESMTVAGTSEDMSTLLERIDGEMERIPSLIIIDTLARCFEGDENQQEDMGAFIAGLDTLRHRYGAAVLTVHHTRLGGDRERGNTALRGGTDTMISVSRGDNGIIQLECTKQKDAEHFPSLEFTLRQVPDTDSCVVISSEGEKAEKSLEILEILEANGSLGWDAWLSLSGMSKSTFGRYFSGLKKTGQIIKENGNWRAINPNESHDPHWHK